MGAEFEISGIQEMQEKLRALDDKLQNKVERDALKAGGKVLAARISQRMPRSANPRKATPGSQAWRTGKHAADDLVIGRVRKDRDGLKYIEVGPVPSDNSPYFYTKFVEWGTSKIPARPSVGPAAAESKSDVLAAMAAQLKKGLGLS